MLNALQYQGGIVKTLIVVTWLIPPLVRLYKIPMLDSIPVTSTVDPDKLSDRGDPEAEILKQ